MRTLPREIIEAAAKKSSPHFEFCDRGDNWEDCRACRAAFDRAHDAVRGALGLIVEQIAERVEKGCPWPTVGDSHGPCDYADAAEIVRKAFTEENADA